MGLLDDIKAKADLNGDGKISKGDLEAIKDGDNSELIEKLKGVADRNEDGKLSLDDTKNFDLSGTLSDLKNKFF